MDYLFNKYIIVSILILLLGKTYGDNSRNDYKNKSNTFAIVTYVQTHEQMRSVDVFIKSIRDLGGKYSNSEIYVVLVDPENFPCDRLKGEGVTLVNLEMGSEFLDYILAVKAFAAAQIEKFVGKNITTLAWFDPGTLVLDSLHDLALDSNYDVAVRPVSLNNTIGLTPGTQPNEYWEPIYKATKLNYKDLPTINTIVDEVDIQPYYNCEIFSVNPQLGIFTEWAEVFTKFLEDEKYQEEACTTFLRKLFLHQAVLSAVISSNVDNERIKKLPLKSGYPFNQHQDLSPDKQISSLNELSAIIFDYVWEQNGRWMERIPIEEPLKNWLVDTYIEYCQLTDNLYRIEGQCNSYLITTDKGSVLIDPAGAGDAPEYFQRIIDNNPLKAIILTHAHQDHWNNMDVWRTDTNIPIIAQEEFDSYNEYRKRLLPFYTRRGEVYKGNPIPDTVVVPVFNPVKPTITFDKEYTYELGDFHFKMKHTPGETLDHATIWIPELDAVFVGDNYYEYFINNATLRGTPTRPILGYINALDLSLSYNPKFFLMGHGRPIVTRKTIKETVTEFRDVLRYLHDETIKGINLGKDVFTLMNEIRVPERYRVRPYFGSIEWTIRGIYHENIGWFNEDPVSMYSLPISSIYSDIMDIISDQGLVKKSEKLLEGQQYIKVLHLTNIFLASNPKDVTVNTIRMKALNALKARTYNYQERVWLDNAINEVKNILETE